MKMLEAIKYENECIIKFFIDIFIDSNNYWNFYLTNVLLKIF